MRKQRPIIDHIGFLWVERGHPSVVRRLTNAIGSSTSQVHLLELMGPDLPEEPAEVLVFSHRKDARKPLRGEGFRHLLTAVEHACDRRGVDYDVCVYLGALTVDKIIDRRDDLMEEHEDLS